MKRILTPTYDDTQRIRDASENKRLSSYPKLKENLETVEFAYDEYIKCDGDALLIKTMVIDLTLSNALKTHYKSETKHFNFIKEIREESSPLVCPMCGSSSTGTVDHLLPQKHFPEFAVFSKNLVPACDCNSKRKDIFKNEKLSQRVLHPYYDECLNDRHYYFHITSNPAFPVANFKLIYLTPCDHPSFESIKFHIENIVLPSGVKKQLESMWASLISFPPGQIHTIDEDKPIDLLILDRALLSLVRRYDRVTGTENNWNSIFFYSILLSKCAKKYIINIHNNSI